MTNTEDVIYMSNNGPLVGSRRAFLAAYRGNIEFEVNKQISIDLKKYNYPPVYVAVLIIKSIFEDNSTNVTSELLLKNSMHLVDLYNIFYELQMNQLATKVATVIIAHISSTEVIQCSKLDEPPPHEVSIMVREMENFRSNTSSG